MRRCAALPRSVPSAWRASARSSTISRRPPPGRASGRFRALKLHPQSRRRVGDLSPPRHQDLVSKEDIAVDPVGPGAVEAPIPITELFRPVPPLAECAKCGAGVDALATECPRCGVVFAKLARRASPADAVPVPVEA